MRAIVALQLKNTDICGPIKQASYGASYCITFIDDLIRKFQAYFL